MKNLILALTTILMLSGCDLFKSKETILEEHEWILSERTYMNIPGGKEENEYYKKNDKRCILEFFKDGTFHIIENGKYDYFSWNLKDDKITLSQGFDEIVLSISITKPDDLVICYVKDHILYYEKYLTVSSDKWRSDDFVDSYNFSK